MADVSKRINAPLKRVWIELGDATVLHMREWPVAEHRSLPSRDL